MNHISPVISKQVADIYIKQPLYFPSGIGVCYI